MQSVAVPVRIEIWSDVVCPWCYVGKARFDRAVAEAAEDGILVDAVYRSFELDTRVPTEGEALEPYLARKFGSIGAVRSMRTRLAEAGRDTGISFRWDAMQRRNSFDAHRLLVWALRHGATRQAALAERLFRAYFTDGLDIADHGVLARLAAEVGLDHDLAAETLATGDGADVVRAEEARAHENGIAAVPSFVIESQWMLQGAHDVAAWRRALGRISSELAQQSPAGS